MTDYIKSKMQKTFNNVYTINTTPEKFRDIGNLTTRELIDYNMGKYMFEFLNIAPLVNTETFRNSNKDKQFKCVYSE